MLPRHPQGQWAQSPPLWTPSTNRSPFGYRHASAHGDDQRGSKLPLLESPQSHRIEAGYHVTNPATNGSGALLFCIEPFFEIRDALH